MKLHVTCSIYGVEVLETLLLAATLVPALYLLARLERARASNPEQVRRFGAAVGREALGAATGLEVIGYFDGQPIYGSVYYLGMRYRFESVVPASYRTLVGRRELFVEPGLLYLAD